MNRGRPKMTFSYYEIDKKENGWTVKGIGKEIKIYVFVKIEKMLDFLRDHS